MKMESLFLRRGRQMVADLSSMGARDLGLSRGRANRASGIRSRIFFIPAYIHVGQAQLGPQCI